MNPKIDTRQPRKINLGSGQDYRPDFINIDANPDHKPDLLLNLEIHSLLPHFPPGSITLVLAQDFLEHLLRPMAVKVLREIFTLLTPNCGTLIARLPNASLIIDAPIPTSEKIPLLFGGQDLPQDDNPTKNAARANHPEFFAHKFGWTPETFHKELQQIGFVDCSFTTIWPNFTAVAKKPKLIS